jgi:tRNA(Ile)-lysidine synthase
MQERVLSYIRRLELLAPGDRVAVAVSGGADSVALARVLLELRAELGIVLLIAHLNHGIRAEADDDQRFVEQLAAQHQLVFVAGHTDVPSLAVRLGISLEGAARQARYEFFAGLVHDGQASRVATGHTADDQAETVLLKFLRGAGSRGLAGIFPRHELAGGSVVRPLLEARRTEVEAWLRSLGQDWREDASNRDLHFTRNRVRHQLLPLLAAQFNPAIVRQLGNTAGWARMEEEHWQSEVKRLLPTLLLPGKAVRGGGRAVSPEATISLDCEKLARLSTALQRRLIRAAAESLPLRLDFEETERTRLLAMSGNSRGSVDLHGGWQARRGLRELTFIAAAGQSAQPARDFELSLPVPGEVTLPGGDVLRIQVVTSAPQTASYNHRRSVALRSLGDLRVRNWRPGDRFWPLHAGSEKKVKELLQPLRLTPEQRGAWPLVVDSSKRPEAVIWLKGFISPRLVASTEAGEAEVMIEAGESQIRTRA